MIFDTHIHWNHFSNEEKEINLREAREIDLKKIAIPSVRPEEWDSILELRSEINLVGIGVHPWYVDDLDSDWVHILRSKIELFDFIGEIGLDFYDKKIDKTQQMNILEIQLDLAEEYDKPVSLHLRKSFDSFFSIIKNRNIKGILHSYSGNLSQAKLFIDRGFKIGICACVCNPQFKKLRKVVREVPLNSILIETDAPYQPIWFERGQRNHVKVLKNILEEIAKIKNIALSKVEEVIYEESCKFFQ